MPSDDKKAIREISNSRLMTDDQDSIIADAFFEKKYKQSQH